MKVSLHRIGNSKGVILPKPLLAQVGLVESELDMSVEDNAIVLRRLKEPVRSGWAAAAKQLADAGDDSLVWPEFPNDGDESLIW